MSQSKILTYDYLRFPKRDPQARQVISETFAPFIPLRILYGHKLGIAFHALVDSGATRNLLPAAFGEQVGINVRKGKATKILGIGNKEIIAFSHKIKIYLGLNSFETDADFSSEQDIPLLGREGFFNLFQSITFDENFRMLKLILKVRS